MEHLNASLLLSLAKNRSKTPDQLKRTEPQLLGAIQSKASDDAQELLVKKFARNSKAVRGAAQKLSFARLGDRPTAKRVRNRLIEELRESQADEATLEEANTALSDAARIDTPSDLVPSDVPLELSPSVSGLLATARVISLGETAKLPEERLERLAKEGLTDHTLTDAKLGELVKKRVLEEREAQQLGKVSSLDRMLDGQSGLTKAAAEKFDSIQDYARLAPKEWVGIFGDREVELPDGMTKDDYAEVVAERFGEAFPSTALTARTAQDVPESLGEDLASVSAILSRQPDLFSSRTTSPDFDALPENERMRTEAGYATASSLLHSYPGLGLGSLFDDVNLEPGAKVREATARVQGIQRVLRRNADVEWLSLDYAPGSEDLRKIDFGGADAEVRGNVLRSMKAYQRAYQVAGSTSSAETLLKAGYHSSGMILADGVKGLLSRTNFSKAAAVKIHESAGLAIGGIASSYGSIIDLLRGRFGDLKVGNAGPKTAEFFEQMDGFSDLFGSQDYCDCEHCKSILGPAAYFVDLMCFVEQNVLDETFTGGLANHFLHLKTRRPDLWTLELSCENTLTEIRQLVIVNELLEDYIAKRRAFGGDSGDRGAVEEFVYRQQVANAVHSFSQPSLIPLETAEIYLAHFEITRSDLATALGVDSAIRTRAALSMSPAQYDLIFQANAGVAFLEAVYGIDFVPQGATFRAVDAQDLLAPMGIERADLTALLASWFVTDGGPQTARVVSQKLSAESVQNDVERVTGLTGQILDRLHRFTRLWRRLSADPIFREGKQQSGLTGEKNRPWKIGEFDLVLRSMDAEGLVNGLDASAAEGLAALLDLQARLGGAVEELVALWSEVPAVPVEEDAEPLFDVLFNSDEFTRLDGTYPKDGTDYLHPSHREAPATGDQDVNTHRLRAALRVSSDDLALLVQRLATPLGLDFSTETEADRSFALTRANLAVVYRHARLAPLLRLSVDELFLAIAFCPEVAGVHVASFGELQGLVAFVDQLKEFKFSLDDLAIVTASDGGDGDQPDGPGLAEAALVFVEEEGALVFTPTLFAELAGVDEAASRAIVDANSAIFADVDDVLLRLASTYSPASAVVIPDGVPATAADVHGVLAPHTPAAVLHAAIGSAMNIDQAIVPALFQMVGVDLAHASFARIVHREDPSDPLATAISAASRLGVLFDDDAFSAAALQAMIQNPGFFGALDWTALDVPLVRRVLAYRELLDGADDVDDPVALISSVLGDHTAAAGFAAADADELAAVLDVEPSLVRSLTPEGDFGAQPIDALAAFARAADVAQTLGMDGTGMAQLASESYELLASGSDAAFASFRAKYPDEEEWQQTSEPFTGAVLERKRDALVSYCVHSLRPEFSSASELYEYFLIDPKFESCFLTSRVVAATNSLQLYVHRVLMNLEKDRGGALHVRPDLIDRDEWDWRQLYRVWEANRKVFLWPENWIIPDLRDNKTPLFEDLESEMLQREVTEQSVMDAYGAYLQSFEELANLKVAGAYHDINEDTDTDVLYLFGVSAGDPPTYYFRTAENLYYGSREDSKRGPVWSPWKKMDVRITAERVAPVVYHGRLYLFWVDSTALAQNSVDDGKSRFVGYSHKWGLHFSSLRLDGRWEPPQRVSLYGVRPFYESDGVLEDPLAEPDEWTDFVDALNDWFIHGLFGDRSRANDLASAKKKLLTPRYDTEMHTKARDGYSLSGFPWDQVYPEPQSGSLRLYGVGHEMHVSVDLFDKTVKQVSGWSSGGWIERINTGLFAPPAPILCAKGGKLYRANIAWSWFPKHALCETVIDKSRLDTIINWPEREWGGLGDLLEDDLYDTQIATVGGDADYACINGAHGDAVVTVNGDQLLMRQSVRDGEYYVMERLGTTVAETVARALFTQGVDGLLDIETQKKVKEATAPVTVDPAEIHNKVKSGELDFTGPYGTYYREIFFHIPFTIAHYLNSQKKYAESQRWYHHVFNPTATEIIPDDPALSDEQNALRSRDRNWRYIEFRDRNVESLRDILTDAAAIEAYRSDPFNPHAIARLRLSAYQKTIVMKYVDNLLDWADSLFTQFQRETVNEALTLYVTAANILGERPAELGSCGEGPLKPRTYEAVKPHVKEGSEFLAEVETWVYSRPKYARPARPFPGRFVLDKAITAKLNRKLIGQLKLTDGQRSNSLSKFVELNTQEAKDLSVAKAWSGDNSFSLTKKSQAMASGLFLDPESVSLAGDLDRPDSVGVVTEGGSGIRGLQMVAVANGATQFIDEGVPASRRFFEDEATEVGIGKGRTGALSDRLFLADTNKGFRWKFDRHVGAFGRDALPSRQLWPYMRNPKFGRPFGWSFVRQVGPVFCVPYNKTLLDYWDRVEDRLYKLRNCLDITGRRRSLSLFAPEIDPGMLVRARAAGLSLGDVLGADAGGAPPFRFPIMLDRAKAAAAVAQSFGAALNAAIERKDAEELVKLRNQHQQNVLSMTSRSKDWEVDAAQDRLEALEARLTGLVNRQSHYDGLSSTGLTGWERTLQVSKHRANVIRGGEAAMIFLAGGLHAIPQVGSPFAMKYGGQELGNSAHRIGAATRTLSTMADQIASSAGLEAGFQRRDEGWQHQFDTLADQIKEVEKQIEAAKLQVEIANRSRDLHNLALEQARELEDFYADRFSNFGLYEWMSTQLQRIYREAYNTAFALARLAERAYRFEHDDESASFFGAGYWDGLRSGLLAAAQLTNALLAMERRHIETREQRQEVDLPISLSQIDPAALIELKQTGTCEFDLGEVYFDLAYRGQYHRKIRSVRLTIPCITGPYVNVSAQLELLQSYIRTVPQAGDEKLVPAPRARTNEIVTSSAQNDAGVFELSFNGADYAPFEGAGSVSQWRLTLPKTLRQFDYGTINDVVVHVAYTARYDGVYRETVEQQAGTLETRLGAAPLSRAFSLRQEFSSAWNKLLQSPRETQVDFELSQRNFPLFVQGRNLTTNGAKLVVLTKEGVDPGALEIAVNGTSFNRFDSDPRLGGARRADLGAAFAVNLQQIHILEVRDSGDLGPEQAGVNNALDPTKIEDLILLVDYTI